MLALVVVGSRAERGYETATEVAPIGELRRHHLANLDCAQMQETMPAPAVERLTNPRRERDIEHWGIVLGQDNKSAVWGECGCKPQLFWGSHSMLMATS